MICLTYKVHSNIMFRQKQVDIDAATILITLLISLVLPDAVFKTRQLRVTRRLCMETSARLLNCHYTKNEVFHQRFLQ